MRRRSDRLQKVFDLARAEERKVCEEMGRAQQSLEADINRLRDLESYRRNYGEQMQSQGLIDTSRWQDYQHFLQRLDQAVAGQKLQIEKATNIRDAHRRRWLVERQKLDSLQRVIDRSRKSELLEVERKDQKTLDDLNSSGRFFDLGNRD